MPVSTNHKVLDYPVLFHQESNIWGYCSPDFGGGGASDYDEALELAQDLLNSAVDLYTKSGKELPKPTDIADIDVDGGHVEWLQVNMANSTSSVLPGATECQSS